MANLKKLVPRDVVFDRVELVLHPRAVCDTKTVLVSLTGKKVEETKELVSAS